jgi:peptide/nickel transport system permease protein
MTLWRTVKVIATRLGERLLVLLIIATILFFMFRLMPGSPLVAYISPTFTGEQQAELMKSFGLDKPLPVQYAIYMGNLVRGDLGRSFFYKKPVAELMGELLPNTLMLTVIPLLIAYSFGVVVGTVLAWRRGSRVEGVGIIYTLISRSAPEFWVGMLLLTLFAFRLNWFPASGATSPGVIYPDFLHQFFSRDFWKHLILPALTMAFYLQGLPLLLMRSNMLDVLEEDFVTMARMKGISEWRVVLRHAARNALLPVATAMALGIGYTIGGDVVVETIFSWPGLGRMLVRAVANRDYPLAQGAFFVLAALMVLMNLVADLLYYALDPRVGRSSKETTS